MPMKDRDWENLLKLMKTGAVVPVVGSRLLVDAEGRPLSQRLARRLLDSYEVQVPDDELPPYRELNHAVTVLKKEVKNPQVLYTDIDGALADLLTGPDAVPMPSALQQLAGITDFRLMVTLTPDDLLAQALRSAGRGVHEVVHSPKLPTDDVTDLQVTSVTELKPPDGPPFAPVELLYLFGKSRATPMCAIHDEDLLEYAHNIICNGSHVPEKFMGMLQECSLLLVGCNFPDWLSRFILRATRKGGFAATSRPQWLVDRLANEDPFVGFLGQYNEDTEVLTSIEPTQFVQELRERWDAREAAAAQRRGKPAAAAVAVATTAMSAGTPAGVPSDNTTFFISYSRTTDKASALALRAALLQLGVKEPEIWFDANEIEPGDDFQRRILDGIRGCRYFVPLVSRAATQRERAFVFREWHVATDEDLEINRTYLVPVVVDDDYKPEVYRQDSVATWLDRKIDFGHAPSGQPDERTLAVFKKLLREARG
jgi:hypothetical protein